MARAKEGRKEQMAGPGTRGLLFGGILAVVKYPGKGGASEGRLQLVGIRRISDDGKQDY
jgi:hypothetical protein